MLHCYFLVLFNKIDQVYFEHLKRNGLKSIYIKNFYFKSSNKTFFLTSEVERSSEAYLVHEEQCQKLNFKLIIFSETFTNYCLLHP